MEKDEKDTTRFLQYVHKSENGCWLWIGGRAAHGYGSFHMRGRTMGAHRASYILHKGPIPTEGKSLVCHTCGIPPCVNPEHLFLGTAADNTQDKINKQNGETGSYKRRPWIKSNLLPDGIKKDALVELEGIMWEFGLAPTSVGREISGSPNFLNHMADPDKSITTGTLDKVRRYVVEKRGQMKFEF